MQCDILTAEVVHAWKCIAEKGKERNNSRGRNLVGMSIKHGESMD